MPIQNCALSEYTYQSLQLSLSTEQNWVHQAPKNICWKGQACPS